MEPGERGRRGVLFWTSVALVVFLVAGLGAGFFLLFFRPPGDEILPGPRGDPDRWDALEVVDEGRWQRLEWALRGEGVEGGTCTSFRWLYRLGSSSGCVAGAEPGRWILRLGGIPPSQPGEPHTVDGIVAGDVVQVRVEFEDGSTLGVTTLPIPGSDLRVFLAIHPHRALAYTAFDAEGTELERRS